VRCKKWDFFDFARVKEGFGLLLPVCPHNKSGFNIIGYSSASRRNSTADLQFKAALWKGFVDNSIKLNWALWGQLSNFSSGGRHAVDGPRQIYIAFSAVFRTTDTS
jgi:hypothetical protein